MRNNSHAKISSNYIIGDSRAMRALLKGEPLADVVITSPPYFQVLDYGVRNQIGKGSRDYSAFLKEVGLVLKYCYGHSKADGSLWLVCDSFRSNGVLVDLPSDFKRVAIDVGWKLREVIVWNKVKTRPQSSPGTLRNNIEYILVFFKDSNNFKFRVHRENSLHGKNADYIWKWPERYSPLGLNPGKIWTIPIMNQGTWSSSHRNRTRIHFCPFPQDLVSRIINITTDPGDVVLDPFAGAGTVPVQAELMGRYGIGVEMNRNFRSFYKEIADVFRSRWDKQATHRKMVQDDRIREALLISRMRALKAMGIMLGASTAVSRGIKELCILEPVTASEEVEKALSSSANSTEVNIQYDVHIYCDAVETEASRRLKVEFAHALKECSIKGRLNVYVDRRQWKKTIAFLSARWWLYDGARQMKPVGGDGTFNEIDMSGAMFPVLSNFSAPAFGSKNAPLESAIVQFKQEFIRQVARNIGSDESQIANVLGTSRLEIHKYLSLGSGHLRKATRTQEQVLNGVEDIAA